jgi:ubiquinone/menaquinone biosynthesis C-methylase UbiE
MASERRAIFAFPAPGIELHQIERLVTLAGRRVLEIGCGAGRLTLQLARRASSVIAVDPDPARIAVATQAAASAGIRNIRFTVGSGERRQARDGSVDTVVFSWSL